LGSTTVAEELIDSYSEVNYSTYTGAYVYIGQAFSADKSGTLTRCKFSLHKAIGANGTLIAYLYNLTGTYGTNAKPTGSPIATSNTIDVTSLGLTRSLITFTFTEGSLVAGNKYGILTKRASGTGGVNTNLDNTSPTHSGNYFNSSNGTTWTGSNAFDLLFYVYANVTTIIAANPVIRDLGLTTGKSYSISVSISGTIGTLTLALGDGTSQACSPGTTTFTGTQGSGYFTMTPSNDFDGTITRLTINEV
jgi:hypothetical protein